MYVCMYGLDLGMSTSTWLYLYGYPYPPPHLARRCDHVSGNMWGWGSGVPWEEEPTLRK